MDPLTMLLVGAAVQAGSSALTYGLNASSSKRSAKLQYKYQSQLLRQQQAFAEYMSNTAHQREVADLREAGLNPILTATGGNGASTPVVSAPSFSVNTPEADFDILQSAKALGDLGVASENSEANQKAVDTNEKAVDANIKNQNERLTMDKSVAEAQKKLLDNQAKEAAARTKEIEAGLPINRLPGSALNAIGKGINSSAFADFLDSGHSALQRGFDWLNNGPSKKSKGTIIPVSDTVHNNDGSRTTRYHTDDGGYFYHRHNGNEELVGVTLQ